MPKHPLLGGSPDPEFDVIELLACRKTPLTFTEIRVQLGEFTNYQYQIPRDYLSQYLIHSVRAGILGTGRNTEGSRVFWYARPNA